MRTYFLKSALFILCIAISALFFRCDELLPPRDDPGHVMAMTFESVPGTVVIRAGQPGTGSGGFRLQMKNLHDEVLQGESRVRAVIDIWIKDHPERHNQTIFTEKDIVGGTSFPGFVTIGVDSAIVLQGQWSHMSSTTDEGFWQYVSLFPEFTIAGVPYCRSDSVHLVAQCSFQLFKNVQPLRARIEFSLVYNVFGITCSSNTTAGPGVHDGF